MTPAAATTRCLGQPGTTSRRMIAAERKQPWSSWRTERRINRSWSGSASGVSTSVLSLLKVRWRQVEFQPIELGVLEVGDERSFLASNEGQSAEPCQGQVRGPTDWAEELIASRCSPTFRSLPLTHGLHPVVATLKRWYSTPISGILPDRGTCHGPCKTPSINCPDR